MTKELAIINYLSSNVSELFQTKLYKLLFYIDFLYYKRNERSITENVYFKLPFGPVPLSLKTRIDALIDINSGNNSNIEDPEINEQVKLYNSYIKIKEGDKQGKILIEKNGDLDIKKYLSDNELETVHEVIKELGTKTTKEIIIISHNEDGYKETPLFSPIFYGFAKSLSI